ncbi:MAG TPA: ribosome biogenesis GTP-binding protein YihA/YsxC, partial [Candidatus Limnocylindria bacterium]|nr:ribosome biogenesis GTP-binding protein YihA/YsxC [Candidatus Limnocylindria bacterium]
GRKLFAGPCDFMLGVAALHQLPEAGPPEVAFAGRSNVGKSSLINALRGRSALARTSKTPGRTQQLNLFDLGGGRLILVDMPGYGYAQAPKPLVDSWNRLIRGYLRGRPTLRRVCLLVDARHGVKDSDRALMDMLGEAAVVFQVVLTKSDAIGERQLAERIGDIGAELAKRTAAHPQVLATSAAKGTSLERLRAELAALAA